MSEFAIVPDFKPILNGNAVPALGNIGVPLVIKRQNRRLQTIWVHASVTLAGTSSGTNTDKLESLFSEIRLKVNDSAGDRYAFKQPSSTLIHWYRKHNGPVSRFVQTSIGQVTAGKYDVFVPLCLVHPLSESPIGYRQSLPLWAKDETGIGLADDPVLELDFAASAAAMGLTGVTVTINFVRAVFEYTNIRKEDGVAYVPSVLQTQIFTGSSSGGAGQTFDIVKDGYLTSSLYESFTTLTSAANTRANVLSGINDFYQVFFGRTPVDTFYPSAALNMDESWSPSYASDVAALNAHQDAVDASGTNNVPTVFTRNYWHTRSQAAANSLNSCPDLNSQNKGDLLSIVPSSMVANGILRVTHHKFLVADPRLVDRA